MLDLSDLIVFTTVVETENLTEAGERLGLPKSTISRRLTRLEDHLGVQLLHRSTRSVSITKDGALFFDYCLRSLGVLKDGERALADSQAHPQGIVKVAVPYVLGQSLMGPIFANFLDQYPGVKLVSTLSDDPIALLRRGYDVALATGPLIDSGLISTKLGTSECGFFGAPGYFERMGAPQTHIELTRFALLATGTADSRQRWMLHHNDVTAHVDFSARFLCNDLELLRVATIAELGIANLPAFMCKLDLAQGRLVEVLPGWKSADMTFHALFADPKTVPVRIRTLIDFLVLELRQKLSWEIN